MNEHETEFVTTFILREKRQRYIQLLSNKRRRSKILDRLNHNLDVDYTLASVVSASSVNQIIEYLRKKGAGARSYLIADSSNWDGKECDLDQALSFALTHQFGVLVSCIPGRLVFYKTESPGPVYVLEKRRTEKGTS